MRIKVLKKKDVWVAPRKMVSYNAGEKTVRRAIGDQLVALGIAEEVEAPPRPDTKGPESE